MDKGQGRARSGGRPAPVNRLSKIGCYNERMAADFRFSVDPDRSLVRITMGGFFDESDIARFSEAQDAAYRRLRCLPNQHLTMVDIRTTQIQSQDSVSRFQRRLADPSVAARRIAFVVARSLARMQIKRATEGLPAGMFTSDAEAEQWLLRDDPRPA